VYLGVDNLVVVRGNIVRDFYPYFYTCDDGAPGEPTDLECWIFDGVTYKPSGKRAKKITVKTPAEVRTAREKFKLVSQSYIPYALRASADLLGVNIPLKVEPPPSNVKIMAFDIEVVGKKRYFAWSIDGDVTYSEMVKDLIEAARETDYVVGYNSWEFDYRYLGGYKYFIAGVPHIDLYKLAEGRYRSSFGLTESGSSLYEVAVQLGALPEGVTPTELLRKKLKRAKLHQLTQEELKDYLATDVIVTLLVGKKWMPILLALSKATGFDPLAIVQSAESGASPAILAEVMYHKQMEEVGAVLVDRTRERDFEGGDKVKAKAPGIYEGVYEYDFHMMYPTTYREHYVDPTGVRECADGYEVKFKDGSMKVCFDGGPIFEVLKSFYDARAISKKISKDLDQAVKIMANAAYGAFGKRGLGVVCEPCAAFIFQYTEDIFEAMWQKFDPIYGDTDSVYVQRECLDELNAFVKKWGERYELKLEAKWDKLVLVPKQGGGVAEKNYIKMAGDKVVVKGGKLRPHNMPRVLRYGGYRELIISLLSGKGMNISDILNKAKLDELFVEKSSTYRDIFYNEEGELKERLDPMSDLPILLTIMVEQGLEQTVATPKRMEGAEIDPSEIYSALFIPEEKQGEVKQYVLLARGEPYRAWLKHKYSKGRAELYAKWQRISTVEVRVAAERYIRGLDAISTLKSLLVKRLV